MKKTIENKKGASRSRMTDELTTTLGESTANPVPSSSGPDGNEGAERLIHVAVGGSPNSTQYSAGAAPPRLPWCCEHCTESFKTKRGRSLHTRARHWDAYNAEVKARETPVVEATDTGVVPPNVNARKRWSEAEEMLMARFEVQLLLAEPLLEG